MSDDFGTVNVKRGDRAREIEVLRQRYRTHRESLGRLVADAPTEALAAEYQRLIVGIDNSIRKLDELEGPRGTDLGSETVRMNSSPGMRPLATTPPPPPVAEPVNRYAAPPPVANPTSRMALIVIGGLVVLGIIGYLIWHASSRRTKTTAITETSSTAITTAAGTEPPVTPAATTAGTAAPAAGNGALKIAPAVNDYGVVRKGTRVVRQFAITNSSSSPIAINVARSQCHCLIYEYAPSIAPGKKETITVALDGSKAKPGAVDEQITVTAKNDPSVSATFEVRATVK